MQGLLLTLLLLVFAHPGHAAPWWHWEDSFSAGEKTKLRQWVLHAESGLTRLIGPLPFHRMTRGNGPAPWANTDKHRGRAVHFHVNTAYSPDVFRRDWTAPHELSHLMFPYLGDEGRWFAEGLSSYLQYLLMYANETITWKQATGKLAERFRAARRYESFDGMSISRLSHIVHRTGAYVRLYWGGAAYFLQVDRALAAERNMRLHEVITAYLDCCVYQPRESTRDMIALFDRITDSDIFSRTYRDTVSRDGFPATRDALAWLRQHPPTLVH